MGIFCSNLKIEKGKLGSMEITFCVNGESGIVLESCSAHPTVFSLFHNEIGLPLSVADEDRDSFYDFLDWCDSDGEYNFIVINSKYVLFCSSFGTVETIQDIDEFVNETVKAYEDYRNENET